LEDFLLVVSTGKMIFNPLRAALTLNPLFGGFFVGGLRRGMIGERFVIITKILHQGGFSFENKDVSGKAY